MSETWGFPWEGLKNCAWGQHDWVYPAIQGHPDFCTFICQASCNGRGTQSNLKGSFSFFKLDNWNEDLQDLLELTPKRKIKTSFSSWGLECKRRKSRDTWSNKQVWPCSTKWDRAKINRFLPREHTGHSEHPLPTTLSFWQKRPPKPQSLQLPGNRVLWLVLSTAWEMSGL